MKKALPKSKTMAKALTISIDDFEKTIHPKCPQCNMRRNVIKYGNRTLRNDSTQIYLCKSCNYRFNDRVLPNTPYPTTLILRSLSYFNLGHTLQQTQTTMQRNYKTKIPISTLNTWLNRYSNICTFTNTLRKRFTLDPNTTIHSKKFQHQQVYEFKYHTLKTNIAGKTFSQLKAYITSIHKTPYFIPETAFQTGPRCSELRIDLKPQNTSKNNNAPKLAELAQTLAKTNRDRHQQVENAFLINDTATIAIEVPVYLQHNELTKQEQSTYGLNLEEPLSGHIDILQVRFNKIHILDYKPDAKRSDKTAAEQIFLYALALSKRTKIPMSKFICAFFNDRNYYQFSIVSIRR